MKVAYKDRLILYRALHSVGDDDLKMLIDKKLRRKFDAKTYNQIVDIFVKCIKELPPIW